MDTLHYPPGVKETLTGSQIPVTHILRRLALMVLVLWAIASILFLMFRLMPGDPTTAYIDPTFTAEQRQVVLHQFGLDLPLWQQYLIYLGNLIHGELGLSFRYRTPVAGLILDVLPNTLLLTLTALIVAYAFGALGGALLAWKRGTWVEAVTIPVVLATRAAPEFWLGMLLLAIFAFGLGWFPSGSANTAGAAFPTAWARVTSADFAHISCCPQRHWQSILQGLPLLLMRANMLEVMQEEFITMARMKGLSEWTIMVRPRRAQCAAASGDRVRTRLWRIDRRQCRGGDRVQLAGHRPHVGGCRSQQRLPAGTGFLSADRRRAGGDERGGGHVVWRT